MQEKKSCSKRHFRNRRNFCTTGAGSVQRLWHRTWFVQEKNELRQNPQQTALQIIRLTGSTQRTPRMADDAPAGDGAGARDSTMQL